MSGNKRPIPQMVHYDQLHEFDDDIDARSRDSFESIDLHDAPRAPETSQDVRLLLKMLNDICHSTKWKKVTKGLSKHPKGVQLMLDVLNDEGKSDEDKVHACVEIAGDRLAVKSSRRHPSVNVFYRSVNCIFSEVPEELSGSKKTLREMQLLYRSTLEPVPVVRLDDAIRIFHALKIVLFDNKWNKVGLKRHCPVGIAAMRKVIRHAESAGDDIDHLKVIEDIQAIAMKRVNVRKKSIFKKDAESEALYRNIILRPDFCLDESYANINALK